MYESSSGPETDTPQTIERFKTLGAFDYAAVRQS
jgi:hypothetical protein